MSTTGLDALLTAKNSVLLLIDHQLFQFANLHSHQPALVINHVVGLAKVAQAYNVPTIFTTVLEGRGGNLIQPLQDVIPDQKPIDRTTLNSWEDQQVVDAVGATGRKKLIIAGLDTEICVAMPALHALADGHEVYVVTDASGGVSNEAHDMAVRRMVQAGVVPITWNAVQAEWQRDWARTGYLEAVGPAVAAHGGGSAVAFAWETQLLSNPAGSVNA